MIGEASFYGLYLPWIMVLALAALLVLPPMAVIGLLLYRRPREPPTRREKTVSAASPREAWIEVEGGDGAKCPIGHGPIRIGRQADNEICLDEATVHRYHAVIQRTFDSGIVIKDVSGPNGNGVKLNGSRIDRAVLVDGDLVQVGSRTLRFGARELLTVEP